MIQPFPSLITAGVIEAIFVRLTEYEVRRQVKAHPFDAADHLQCGYVDCLIDFFGTVGDELQEEAFDKGQTWLHVVERIIDQDFMQDFIKSQQENPGSIMDRFEEIDKAVTKSVRDYLKNHMDEARTAIRHI